MHAARHTAVRIVIVFNDTHGVIITPPPLGLEVQGDVRMILVPPLMTASFKGLDDGGQGYSQGWS